MIQFPCDACGKMLKVGPDKAGQQGKCPGCGAQLTVPIEASAVPDDDLFGALPDAGAAPGLGMPGAYGQPPQGQPPYAPPPGYAPPGYAPPNYGQAPQYGTANPYTAPAGPAYGRPAGAVGCPKCGSPNNSKVGWTIWGGIIGPWMLSHVRCVSCGTTYNGKTGKSNNTAIAIYLGVSLGFGLLVGLFAVCAGVLNA